VKIQPKTIWVRRAEGRTEEIERDGEHTVSTFAEADEVLKRWAWSAPDTGGYDKCDFKVVYEDGEEYEGRFDLKRDHRYGENLLGKHMLDFVTFYAGVRCPGHMKPAQYEAFMHDHADQQIETAKFMLGYQMGA